MTLTSLESAGQCFCRMPLNLCLFVLTLHGIPSASQTSNALSKYLLSEEIIRGKEPEGKSQQDFPQFPPFPLFSLLKGVVVSGNHVVCRFESCCFYNTAFPLKERLSQGIVSLLSLQVCKETPDGGLAGMLESGMEHVMRDETQPA